ncbi:hypothetical protein Taro_042195 [Colocasia esculenta]|uniref:Uncharacterized protein n=1 Tax=Colocasia esculenta TaxID=4460 RepID=A0A843WNV6_COLES|nr:hypothetical protein [Colocasia esculenta]
MEQEATIPKPYAKPKRESFSLLLCFNPSSRAKKIYLLSGVEDGSSVVQASTSSEDHQREAWSSSGRPATRDLHRDLCDCIQEKHKDTSAKDQEKHFKWSCVDSHEVPCRQIVHPEQTSYSKLKWSSSCRHMELTCRQIRLHVDSQGSPVDSPSVPGTYMVLETNFEHKKPPYQNPKQNPREKASPCCSASTVRPERRRSIFRVELKTVRPWFKLLCHLRIIKGKLGVLMDDQQKEFFIGICSFTSELLSFRISHASVCVVVIQASLVLDSLMRIQWSSMGQGKSDEHPSYEEMKY